MSILSTGSLDPWASLSKDPEREISDIEGCSVDVPDLIDSGRAADISDTIPLDLRMSVAKGERLLQMPFPGVDEVLASHQPTTQPSN